MVETPYTPCENYRYSGYTLSLSHSPSFNIGGTAITVAMRGLVHQSVPSGVRPATRLKAVYLKLVPALSDCLFPWQRRNILCSNAFFIEYQYNGEVPNNTCPGLPITATGISGVRFLLIVQEHDCHLPPSYRYFEMF